MSLPNSHTFHRNGEFGPVYASPDDENHEQINQQRYNLLGQQLKIYKQDHISWSIWLYKVRTSPFPIITIPHSIPPTHHASSRTSASKA